MDSFLSAKEYPLLFLMSYGLVVRNPTARYNWPDT